jgi:protein O-GlcNAc transferase
MNSKTPLVPQPELVSLFDLFNTRQYAAMESAAQKLATRYPRDGQAWKAWGIAVLVQRKDALVALRQAAELLPLDVEVKSSLGGVYSELGQYGPAAACYREALQIQPALAYLHSNLGDVLARAGDHAAAEASCRVALQIQPNLAAAHVNLGTALQAQGRLEEATASYSQALALNPKQVEVHRKLAWLRTAQGRMVDAAAHLREALKIDPQHAATHYQLGSALLALDDIEESVTSLQRAVTLEPLHALAHSNLGNGLMRLGRFDEAVQHHQHAALLAPDQIIVLTNLGHALKASGRPADALVALKRALALDDNRLDLHSQVLFLQQYQVEGDPAQSLKDAMHFGALADRQATARTAWPNARQPNKRLRVGLLSGDLREHPVGYFIESVLVALSSLQADEAELVAYANQHHADALTDRLRACCSVWREVAGLSDGELAACISADGVDVLIDLAGHTFTNRLPVLAWRPAPVQVSWLGYCATTGMSTVDAFIGDPWIAPLDAENQVDDQFAEPVLRLPYTFLCFTPPQFDLPVSALPALSSKVVRFAGFNDLAKMNDAVVALWSRVLQAVSGSTLVLQSASLQDAVVRQSVLARYALHGIRADQLELKPAQPRAAYLAAYGKIDIALDPFPYPGGTTSLEAMWMGVPVLTLRRKSALSRQGQSLLQNLGLANWIATSEDDYVQRAVRHAGDLVALSALRQSLRARLLASPLCDAPRFARDLEVGLRGLWRQYCDRVERGSAR